MNGTETSLPTIALRDGVLFPRMLLPLSVGRAPSVRAVEAAAASASKTLLVATQTDPSVDDPQQSDLFPFATRAVVKRVERAGEVVQVVLQGIDRARIVELAQTEPHLVTRIQVLPEPTEGGTEVEALHGAVLELAQRIAQVLPQQAAGSIVRVLAESRDVVQLAYLLAALLDLDAPKAMPLLAADTRAGLLRQLHDHMAHQLEVLTLREQISAKARLELDDEQRRYLLRQQLQTIREELGEDADAGGDVEELRERLAAAKLPDAVRAETERELKRLQRIPAVSPEHQLLTSWLELVAALPWQTTSADHLDLREARRVLDEDHFGLDEVKTRIVEHLAVMKLNADARAPILCFVGPPGVGKTSLGKSIARAMGRRFERLSLGGVHDEAELRGHRRTYIGAMPGRIVQAIRRAGTRNPLLMLDEVDKLGYGVHGDPAAALLEILDPAQNSEFHDNYLDVPFDLSRAFFVTTANTLDTVPRPLLDRMEVIRVSGYTEDEKVAIARGHLLPRQRQQAGLREEQLELPEPALRRVVRSWTREAGVRQLERMLGALCRKAAARIASGDAERVTVEADGLRDLLGPERYHEEDTRTELEPGVVPGLAYTEAGGAVLYVETLLLPQSHELVLTGQLGEVMRESARAALSWVRSHAQELGVAGKDAAQGVHVHVPAGATPKDGPSAGVAMVAALASLFTGLASRSDLAMTGEITLSGLVLPVGGIREKLLAAHRGGMRAVVVPAQNEPDVANLPANVKQDLQVTYAQRVTQVLEAAIPDLAARLRAARPERRHGGTDPDARAAAPTG